jgi:hypothetical protein
MTEVQVLARRVFIGILVVFVDQVHEEYMDELLISLQVNMLHYKGIVHFTTPFQCTSSLIPVHVSQQYARQYSRWHILSNIMSISRVHCGMPCM